MRKRSEAGFQSSGVARDARAVQSAIPATVEEAAQQAAEAIANVGAKIEQVAQTSAKLRDELEKSRGRVEFDSAHKSREEDLDPAFARIVEKVFVENIEETYDRLEAALRVGEKRSDYGTMMRALDEAETNARLAHRLWITGKVERDRWELENQAIFGAMRQEAVRALQREKEAGLRSKQITDADVDAACAALHPDEWRAQEMRRRKTKAMVDSLENLVEAWMSRCRTLQTMLSKQRGS